MPLPQYPLSLKSQSFISQRTLQLNFELVQPTPTDFTFVAGQFVQLQIPSKEGIKKRSYSIANSPASFRETDQLEIAISLVEKGLASEFFEHAEAESTVNMSGPFGALTLPDTISGQLVLVSTGTGIAPYRSMLPHLGKLISEGVAITIISGARHRDEQLYLKDFSEYHSIRMISCLSREATLHSDEQAGYVQQQFSQLDLNPAKDIVYLCGNPFMIDDSVRALTELGLPARHIKREKYVYSGH